MQQHQPRLRPSANLDSRIKAAEAEGARWTRVVERMNAAGEPTRAARGLLRAARNELKRLDRSRDTLRGATAAERMPA